MRYTRKPVEYYFREKHQAKNIGKKSINAYFFTAGTNGIKLFINIASVAILARLLLPEDFGYVAMAAAFVSTPKILTGQYLSLGIVQAFSISPKQLNGFFWISLGLTLILTFLSVVSAPLVAWFFEEPLLTNIVLVKILMILLAGLSAPHHALLTRTMQFGVISMIDLGARTISKLLAIVLAFLGAGYWALVAMPVSYEASRTAFLWCFCTFKPKFEKIDPTSKSLLSLGTALSGTAIISSVVSEIDKIVIGKFMNSYSLGLYSKAYNLGELPGKFVAWPLGSIAVSALSRLQGEKEKYKQFFLTMSEGYFFVIASLMLTIYLSCEDIVLFVLGKNWQESIPILKYLTIFFLFKHFARPIFWFLTSTYQSGSNLNKIFVFSVSGNIFNVMGILAGIHWGTVGISVGLAISAIGFFIGACASVFHKTMISTRAFLKILWKTIVAIVLTICLWHLLQNHYDMTISSNVLSILFATGFSFAVYCLSFLCLPGGKKSAMEIGAAIQAIRKKKNKNFH